MNTKFRFAAALLLALAGSLAQQAAHAYSLTFQTSANPVNVGDNFTIKVLLDDPAYLGSADLFMEFDNALVEATGASSPSFLANFLPTLDNPQGKASFGMVDAIGFDATAAGPITLVEMAFKAIAEGSASIALVAPTELGFNTPPSGEIVLPGLQGARVDVRITGRTRPIPEPGSLALLGVAMAAAGYGATRRRWAA